MTEVAMRAGVVGYRQATDDNALREMAIMLLRRLASQYKVLLSGKHAGMQTSDDLARNLNITGVWSLIVGETHLSGCRAVLCCAVLCCVCQA